MRAGYEFRSPYLNSNLISLFSASKFKYNKYKTQKFIFRKILERYLPKKLIFGFKKGFVYPFEDFLQKNKKYSSDSITNNLKEKKLNQNPSWTRFLVRKEIVNDFLKS
jgi:predicted TIM-barrel fold metal-dependent hydrolase